MYIVNPCPICGKPMPFPPELNVCDHKWPESVTTTNNDKFVVVDSSGEWWPK